MNGGWRYSVTVPSWTQATLEDEEAVVFYRIEVGIMPPEHQGEPRTRSVLRRFSHFQKLQRMLKEEMGKDTVASLGLAPKWTPFSVAKKPEQIERRRRELEAWLWKLISDSRIARSRVLNHFLELTDAARLARSPAPSMAGDTPPMALRSGSMTSGAGFHGSEDTMSDFDDTGSDTSFFAAGSSSAEPQLRSSGAAASEPFPPQPGEPFGGPGGGAGSAGGSVAGSPAAASAVNLRNSVAELRLGLRVEHRGNIRRLVRTLQQRLEQASHDMQDAVERMRTDQETKRELYERITALEAAAAAAASTASAADGSTAPGSHPSSGADASPPRTPVGPAMPPGSPPELMAQLAAERQRTTDLQKALQEESGRILELQAQLAAVSAQLPPQPQQLQQRAQQPQQMPQQSRADEQQQPPEAAAGLDPVADSDVAAPSFSAPDPESAALSGPEAVEAGSSRQLEAELQQAQAELQAARSQLEAEAAANRAKQKLLAKEVKSLRKQLDEAKAAAGNAAPPPPPPALPAAEPAAEVLPAPAQAAAAAPMAGSATLEHKPLLAEVAALRQRLADCAVESMAAASDTDQLQDGDATGEQLLQTSDDRLQALAAEAALLADDSGAGWSEAEQQLRAAFATVLQENAQLHKAVNAALRSGGADGARAVSAAQPNSSGGTHSVFGRLSGALHNDRGQDAKPGARPPKDGAHGPGAQFADLRTRLSNRFRSASSSEPPPPDE